MVGVASKEEDFTRVTGPLRREVLAHCYRMLGSTVDAEDAVQETYVRAWRAFDRFEGRSSVRVWLYRIATNACLRAIEQRGRRALPSGLGAPEAAPAEHLRLAAAPTGWIDPFPSDPADIVGRREHIRLAFVAALQHLVPRQRAVLILRDVVGLRAQEVARVLGTSAVSVNSALLRARAQLRRAAPAVDTLTEPADPAGRALLDRYVTAFESADIGTLTAVLREDVTFEMPPYATWFAGRDVVVGFLSAQVVTAPDQFRLMPSSALGQPAANGQPTFATYVRAAGDLRLHALQVIDVTSGGVARIHVFLRPELYPAFHLPWRPPDLPSVADRD
ncbi:RNA polymerase subunit sigma-70 [Dactylosporangium matsuzakiense]|uniref:RNA polymerase sigma factor n=1 Tax=Dactylosporangium matsuzakiense TaxID=53360 RepID=A0A9W6KVC6_9ACTN|nr:RNA polymerase subunit sigma-70 [Dactylosporangium matsuzakiense]GLL08333.1 RNA polymerase sigma factor [Dactylosporangium matsuzakiense]